jgi:hypothetical protein
MVRRKGGRIIGTRIGEGAHGAAASPRPTAAGTRARLAGECAGREYHRHARPRRGDRRDCREARYGTEGGPQGPDAVSAETGVNLEAGGEANMTISPEAVVDAMGVIEQGGDAVRLAEVCRIRADAFDAAGRRRLLDCAAALDFAAKLVAVLDGPETGGEVRAGV